VHLPELALHVRRLGRFGGELGVRMQARIRQMPKDVFPAQAEPLPNSVQARMSGAAVRAFEIAVLDDLDRGIEVAEHVIAPIVDGGIEPARSRTHAYRQWLATQSSFSRFARRREDLRRLARSSSPAGRSRSLE